ncbi:gamma-glutamylcyclotransferase [Magnetospirillum fulvum]|uniref:glutathione-specific gamma-glutamylcyclotransferase n=1 Tax=Magnetospirillum fulvum MGU-K5 TaxID=1316936 RepID=S9SDM4_MAGFU|nr:gamma-glutamylcyclotransferase [Magnetospirillum fulvum]EPY02854.1 hypothetical protein K678_03854 [Magnetospirillum fulvum MGU-K5]
MEPSVRDGLWVFAYGSLMWRPDFPHVEVVVARLWGFHRALCILSNHYRGTPERPGLVLGLDRGGSCLGRAFWVAPDDVEEARQRLIAREMIGGVYRPCYLPVRLDDGRTVSAWAFVAAREHDQYYRASDPAALVSLVCQGTGCAGTSRDYLAETVAHLTDLGIADSALHRLLSQVDAARRSGAA